MLNRKEEDCEEQNELRGDDWQFHTFAKISDVTETRKKVLILQLKKASLHPHTTLLKSCFFDDVKPAFFCKIMFWSRKGSGFVFEKNKFHNKIFFPFPWPFNLVVVACKSQICKKILLLLQSKISRRRCNYILTTNSLQVMANFHLNQNDWL